MSCRKHWLCFLFLLCCVPNGYSQDYVYRRYGLSDGLANLTIHSIYQDREGFLWIGTESGLCRYDGTRFKTFTVKDGLAGNDVFGLFEDSKGRLWLQQYKNTIAYIYKGRFYNQQNDSLLKRIRLSSRVYGIAEDGEGNIGFCDNEKVVLLENSTQRIKTIFPPREKPFTAAYMYADSNKQLVVCALQDLYKINESRMEHFKVLLSDQEIGPTNVILHRNYMTYGFFDTKKTIYLRDTVVQVELPPGNILKYSSISDSVFSFNTTNGAVLFNCNTRKLQHLLPGIKVTNAFLDREKNLWIGTISQGLYKLSSPFITNKKIGDNGSDIWYITKERQRIIVGNNNTDIFEYAHNKFTKRNLDHKFPGDMRKVFYYEKLRGDTDLIVHSMGAVLYHRGRQVKKRDLIILKQVVERNDDHVFAAAHFGLFVVRKSDLRIIDTIWKRRSFSSCETNDSMLIGTTAGLFIVKKDNGRYRVADSLLPSSIIGFIARAGNGDIWVSTYEDGIYCLRDGKVAMHITDTSGLPSNNIRSMYVIGNDVWAGTDQGIARISVREDGTTIKKYSISDGLPSNIINSIYVDGRMVYIGTPEGLCQFDETMLETTSICQLVLTAVRVGDSLLSVRNLYSLSRSQQLAVEFAGISFRSEQEMSYRYRISGVDDNWRTTRLNSLEFTSLPYGDHKLEIIAMNKFGKQSQPLVIAFHVWKPFYKSVWFIILCIISAVLAVIFLYNRRVRAIRQKHVLRLQHEIRIMELEQMALRAQMNPHFIFNCISVMQQLAEEKDVENSRKFISSFSNLVRQTLDNATELLIPLEEETRFLASYLELERIRLEDRFNYVIDTSGVPGIAGLSIPNMVVQPFVENAILHGIRYKKTGTGFISVAFRQQGNLLQCTVTDNGIGRKMALQMRADVAGYHKSKGMGITFKRIESLNALVAGNIHIRVDDLTDEQGTATGTSVIIDFSKINDYD